MRMADRFGALLGMTAKNVPTSTILASVLASTKKLQAAYATVT